MLKFFGVCLLIYCIIKMVASVVRKYRARKYRARKREEEIKNRNECRREILRRPDITSKLFKKLTEAGIQLHKIDDDELTRLYMKASQISQTNHDYNVVVKQLYHTEKVTFCHQCWACAHGESYACHRNSGGECDYEQELSTYEVYDGDKIELVSY
jgi:hypothetical protein